MRSSGSQDVRGPMVHVAPYFPPHIGGMENVALTIAEGFASQGPVEVLTSAASAARAPRVERLGNLTIRRLGTWEIAHLPFMPTLLFHLLRLPKNALVHVHVAQVYVPELVWLASIVRRRPFVAHFHLDVEPSGPLGFMFVAYKRVLLGAVLRAATRLIVLTEEQARFVVERYRVRPDRVAVVPNGVAAALSGLSGPRSDHGGRFRLLFVGRLAAQKNVKLLLEAVARVRADVELVIVGDGEERGTLERRVRELRLGRVRFVGARMGDELAEWYGWADAFVIASEREGMPLVVLEAMASGLPVIGTNVPGLANTIGADGILAEPSADALAEAIDTLVSDPLLQRRLAECSRERSGAHSWPAIIEKLRLVYAAVSA